MGRGGLQFRGIDAFGKARLVPSPPRSTLLTLSLPQTMEDVKIKTGFGGLRKLFRAVDLVSVVRGLGGERDGKLTLHVAGAVTLVSLSLIMSLTIYEFVDYRRVHMVSACTRRAIEK